MTGACESTRRRLYYSKSITCFTAYWCISTSPVLYCQNETAISATLKLPFKLVHNTLTEGPQTQQTHSCCTAASYYVSQTNLAGGMVIVIDARHTFGCAKTQAIFIRNQSPNSTGGGTNWRNLNPTSLLHRPQQLASFLLCKSNYSNNWV
jgi:hypothetical protein